MTETLAEAQKDAQEPAEPAEDDETPADPADDDENVEDEPEALAPPPEPGMSEHELEKARGKLERSATTWRNRVSELLGEEAQYLVACELCDPIIPGFHFPPDVESPRDDLHARLLDVLKQPDAPDYMLAQHVRRCATCDGWGVVLSGSRKPDKARVQCPTCEGQGFQGPGQAVGNPAPSNGSVEVVFPEDTRPLVDEDNDIWGSPKRLPDGQPNDNYGKMPQYKNPTLP